MSTKYRSTKVVSLLDHCRDLRHEATLAERLLWRRIKDRQMDGAKFRRQHQYGSYVLDFYCAEHRLAIELDGGQHFTAEGLASDEERTRYLAEREIRVMRFTNPQVLQEIDVVLGAIMEMLGVGSPIGDEGSLVPGSNTVAPSP